MVQTRPVGSNVNFDSPDSSIANARSIIMEPKLLRFGGSTRGPPISRQTISSRGSEPCTRHSTSTRPRSLVSDPYFRAFVHNSCTAMLIESACFGLSRTDGPFCHTRALAEPIKPTASRTTSESEAFCQFDRVNTEWAAERALMRPWKASRISAGTCAPLKV